MLELFFPILIIFIVFCIVEFIAYSIISSVNKKFQWLIMQKDEIPTLSESGLKKFLPHGFDPELGWIRKPNTSHEEIGKYGKTRCSNRYNLVNFSDITLFTSKYS